MNIRSIVSEMRSGLFRHEAEFAGGRERHTALASFGSLGAFLDVLPLPEDMDHADKHAITLALIREFGAKRSPLWSNLLIIAFEPLLVAACTKARELPQDERGSLVLTSFLEAATSANSHEYLRSAPGFLKSITTFNVRHTLACEAADGDEATEVVPYDPDLTCADTHVIFENPLDEIIDHRERLELASKRTTTASETKANRGYWRAMKARSPKAKRAQGAA